MTAGIHDQLSLGNGQPSAAARIPLPTRQRRPGLVALAVLLIVGFALAGGLLVARSAAKAEVLVAARAVPAGHVITSVDLRSESVAGSIRAIAAADAGTVMGKTATVGFVPGQVLNPAMLTDRPVPGAGEATIGLALKPGQMPDALAAADRVQVVAVAGKDQAAAVAYGGARVLERNATVYAVRADTNNAGVVLVTLVIPEQTAPRLAGYAASGQLTVIKVAAP